SCRLVTADGSLVELGEKYTGGLTDKLTELRDKYAGVIEQGFPRHWRRASGYSLNYLLDHRFNPAKLLAGSEGTLGIASEFTLNLVPAPKHTGLV
ncbi:MAG: hypothetical protein GTN99_01265, partial [Candidatus Dadabacteria bacterium]|nr:hypothetical protein [Candidatus Dadabacteria bacterium]